MVVARWCLRQRKPAKSICTNFMDVGKRVESILPVNGNPLSSSSSRGARTKCLFPHIGTGILAILRYYLEVCSNIRAFTSVTKSNRIRTWICVSVDDLKSGEGHISARIRNRTRARSVERLRSLPWRKGPGSIDFSGTMVVTVTARLRK